MKRLSKIDESVWSDMHKRSNGVSIRKEDETNNLHYLEPLDMGGSILWADCDLALNDGDCYFTFDEVFELIKDSDWRLPTLEEVAELDDLYDKGLFSADDKAFYFQYEGNTLIFEKKGLVYTTAGNSPIDMDFYYGWTSTFYRNNNRYVNILTFDNDHPIHTLLNSNDASDAVTQDTHNGKLCVRLVKNK